MIITNDRKEKNVTVGCKPSKTINTFCDNEFHTEPLKKLLESDDNFGFIVMDGNSTLFDTLTSNTHEALHNFNPYTLQSKCDMGKIIIRPVL